MDSCSTIKHVQNTSYDLVPAEPFAMIQETLLLNVNRSSNCLHDRFARMIQKWTGHVFTE